MLQLASEFFMRFADVPYYIQLLAVTVSTVLLLDGKSSARWKQATFWADLIGLFVFFLFSNFLFYVFKELSSVSVGSFLHFLLGIGLYALLRSPFSPSVRVAVVCVVFSIVTLLGSFGTMVGNMLEQYIEGFDIAVTKYVSSVAIVLSALVFSRYPLSRFGMGWFDAVLNGTCNLLSALLCVIYELWRVYDVSFGVLARSFSGYVSLVILFVFLINTVTYFMTYFICREKERVLTYETERQKSRSLEELLRLSEARIAELRDVRHDVKNQYAYMQSMLEEERYADLKRYFEELVGTFSKPLYGVVESGNTMIDSVLNLELSKVRAMGLKLDVRVAVPPRLPFAQSGILALFTNVIDNAAEACVRENFPDAQIDVVVGMQGEYLLFCVTNPTRKQTADEPGVTSKADKNLHGIGARIIRKVVKKYGGHYRCFVREGQYVSETLLDLNFETGKGGATIAEV